MTYTLNTVVIRTRHDLHRLDQSVDVRGKVVFALDLKGDALRLRNALDLGTAAVFDARYVGLDEFYDIQPLGDVEIKAVLKERYEIDIEFVYNIPALIKLPKILELSVKEVNQLFKHLLRAGAI